MDLCEINRRRYEYLIIIVETVTAATACKNVTVPLKSEQCAGAW